MLLCQRLSCFSMRSQWFNVLGMGERYLSDQINPVTQVWNPEVTKLFNEAVKRYEDKQYGKALRRVWRLQQEHPYVRDDHDILCLQARILCERDDLTRFPGTQGSLFFPKFSEPQMSPGGIDKAENHKPRSSLRDIVSRIFVSNFSDDEFLFAKQLFQDYSPQVKHNRVILNELDAKKKYYEGIACYITGEWEESQRLFEDVAPVVPEAKLKEGHSFLLLGQPEKAIQIYEKVIEKASENSSEAFAGLACAYLELGMMDKAGEAFKKSGKKDLTDTANNVLGWLIYRLPQLIFTAEKTVGTPVTFSLHQQFQDEFIRLKRLSNVSVRGTPIKELEYSQRLLNKIHEIVVNPDLKRLFVAEVLSKIVGFQDYSDLSESERRISIPQGNQLVSYQIEKINLVDDVYASGLFPIEEEGKPLPIKQEKYPPILLFRGTSTELTSPGAVVSMYMNLDPRGVAKTLFEKSESIISEWLENTWKKTGHKVQLFGYSQGAALVAMTAARCPNRVQDNPEFASITLNAAASDQSTAEMWEKLEDKPCIKQYLVKGDVVCRLGYELIGDVYEIRYNLLSHGINPHFALSFAQPGWRCSRVDEKADNLVLSRKMITILAGSDLGKELFSHFSEGYLGMILKAINKAGAIVNNEEVAKWGSFLAPLAPWLVRGGTLAAGYMASALGDALKAMARSR